MSKEGRTFIIAEAGVNHNGSIEMAKRLVDAAKAAGADGVKFQSFKTGKLANRQAAKAEYQKRTTARNESQFEMLKRLELSEKDHVELLAYCKRRQINFLSSPFDEASADMLERIGVRLFKVPSGEITNLEFLRHIGRKAKPVILSTGMSTLGEVEAALDAIFATGNKRVSLLHCVTEYPAPIHEINLKAMLTLKTAFRLAVGYSDHTPGIEIAIAAVALGAGILEKHLTLDKDMEGPDHRASLEPDDFQKMVAAIRNVEKSLGTGIKKPAPCELKNIPIARKSVVAARKISKGEKITVRHLVLKRPGHGIQPGDVSKIVGRQAKNTIEADELIKWENLR